MKIAVIIVTYNRLELLKECIEACQKQTYLFEEICVVNNASTDGTTEYLQLLDEKALTVINLNENMGGAFGFYKGAEYFINKEIDYLLFIDDDAILNADYIYQIVSRMESTDNIVAYSGTVVTNNQIQFSHRKFMKNKKIFKSKASNIKNYQNEEYFDYDLFSFCGIIISTKIIRREGLPREDFFIWYDDTEYSIRIGKYGKIRNINAAILNHKTKTDNLSADNWKQYYGFRNRIYIIKKYFSKKELIKFILKVLVTSLCWKVWGFIFHNFKGKKIWELRKRAIIDGLNENLGKNSYFLPYK